MNSTQESPAWLREERNCEILARSPRVRALLRAAHRELLAMERDALADNQQANGQAA
jgi:hypothetical protein